MGLGIKCKIQWVEPPNWYPTPDNNEAVAFVTCDHSTGGPTVGDRLRVYPICEEHLKKMHKNWTLVHIEGFETAMAQARMDGYTAAKSEMSREITEYLKQIQEVVDG